MRVEKVQKTRKSGRRREKPPLNYSSLLPLEIRKGVSSFPCPSLNAVTADGKQGLQTTRFDILSLEACLHVIGIVSLYFGPCLVSEVGRQINISLDTAGALFDSQLTSQ